MSIINNFIGSGLVFPITIDSNGRPPIVNDISLINASIQHIVNWQVNNRYFNEIFGCRIFELLEEPNDAITFSLLRTFTAEAITKWEPRVQLLSINIIDYKDARLDLQLKYKIRNTKTIETFIFPFYREIIY